MTLRGLRDKNETRLYGWDAIHGEGAMFVPDLVECGVAVGSSYSTATCLCRQGKRVFPANCEPTSRLGSPAALPSRAIQARKGGPGNA